MAMPAPRRAPIASPLDEKPLPPWQIKPQGNRLMVTDGTVGFVHDDSVSALRGLAEVSMCWPNGTKRASAFELKHAHHAGWKAGARFMLPLGILLGVLVSTLVQLLRLMVGI